MVKKEEIIEKEEETETEEQKEKVKKTKSDKKEEKKNKKSKKLKNPVKDLDEILYGNQDREQIDFGEEPEFISLKKPSKEDKNISEYLRY